MKQSAKVLFVWMLAVAAGGLLSCGETARVGPHEAYQKRIKEGMNPITAEGYSGRIRIGGVALSKSVPPGKMGPALRGAVMEGKIDVLMVLGVNRELSGIVKDVASSCGYGCAEGQSGIWLLSRVSVAGQEVGMTGYPFEGFYFLLPDRKSLWVMGGDTIAVKEEHLARVFGAFEKRAESHLSAPVVAALGFRGKSEDFNREARAKFGSGVLKPVSGGEGPVQLLASPQALKTLEGVPAAAFAGTEGAGALGLVAVDLWVRPKPAPVEAAPQGAP